MSLVPQWWRSSLGKKYVMAVTGGVLFLFVIGHLVGNLQIFLGPEALNRYGHFLQSNQEILWPVRLGLVGLVGLHIWAAVCLTLENRAARTVGYADDPTPAAASYASRTMLVSGFIIAAFVLYHLLHYTVQVPAVNLTARDFARLHDEAGRHDVYTMMVLGFGQPLVSAFYVVAMALLCTHLSHGVYALCQSTGLVCGCCPGFPKAFAKWCAIGLFIGYISIPVMVLGGYGTRFGPKARLPGEATQQVVHQP